jgi:hypothetical protein
MKYRLTLLILFLVVADITSAQQLNENKSFNDWPPSAEGMQVCILGNVGNPSVIPLEHSFTLMQAIKKAGGALPNTKSTRAFIYREMPDGTIRPIIIQDLRVIERGRATDLVLQSHDIVEVVPHNKRDRMVSKDSLPCGARLMFLLRQRM